MDAAMSKEVFIPFQEHFGNKMLKGLKTCTSRTKKYGNRGDIFKAFGATFQILDVKKHTLEYVATFLYREEGFENPSGFEQEWKHLHPIKGWQPDQVVFTHYFKRVNSREELENWQGNLLD
jgi:hypothetical protein